MAKQKSVEDRIREIVSVAEGHGSDKQRDVTCWKYYNEHYDEAEFEYLTKVGEYTYPAKIRRVGKQRPLINLLVSQQARRSFPFTIRVLKNGHAELKYRKMLDEIHTENIERLMQRQTNIAMSTQELDMQLQQLQQLVSQEPTSEEEAVMISQLKMQLPTLSLQLDAYKRKLMNQALFSKKELEDRERFYRYEYKDLVEEAAQVCVSNIRQRHNAKAMSVKSFLSQVVTGQQYFYVNYEIGKSDIDYQALNTLSFYYPAHEDIEFVQDLPWQAIKTMMTYEDIETLWGHKIPSTKLENLKQGAMNHTASRSALVPTSAGGAVYSTDKSHTGKYGLYSGSTDSGTSYEVWRVWYRKGRWAYAKESPNPRKEGAYFFHIIDEEDVDKLKKDEKLHRRYVEDRYYGVIIDRDIYIEYGKDEVQPRDPKNPSHVYLPVVGKTYNNITDRPYSLIWSTKDLQDLYRIVHYMRELVIAMSGVRSKIIDTSQTPSWMTREEHEYHMKLGRVYIETVDETGRKVNSSFNQWRDFDDTLSASIQYYGMILDEIDREISETMGISRPRKGVTVASDQVGTSMQGQQQSELITEILYYDHDQIEAMALTQAMRLRMMYIHNPGDVIDGDHRDPNIRKTTARLPKEMFDDMDFEVVVENSIEEARKMDTVRQFAMRQFDKGMLAYGQAISIVNSESLKEMEKKLEYFDQVQRDLMQAQQQQSEEAMINAEREKVRFAKEYDMMGKKLDAESKRMAEEVKMRIAQMQEMREQEKLKIERDRLGLEEDKARQDKNLRLLEIASERDVEEKYLMEQSRSNQVNEQLEGIRIQLEALANRISAVNDSKKIEVDRIKANKTTAKEKIKD